MCWNFLALQSSATSLSYGREAVFVLTKGLTRLSLNKHEAEKNFGMKDEVCKEHLKGNIFRENFLHHEAVG